MHVSHANDLAALRPLAEALLAEWPQEYAEKGLFSSADLVQNLWREELTEQSGNLTIVAMPQVLRDTPSTRAPGHGH